MVGVEWVLEGRAHDGLANYNLILLPGEPFPKRSDAARVLRRGYDDDSSLPYSFHFAGNFIDLLFGIHNRIWKDMNGRLRNSLVDQNFATVFLFANKLDTEFLQVGSRVFRPAHPYFGRLTHLEESAGLLGAERHASAQNCDCVRRGE